MASPPFPQSYSEKDVMLAVLGEIRILNLQIAEQGGTVDQLQAYRNDLALTFPLFNTILTPTS